MLIKLAKNLILENRYQHYISHSLAKATLLMNTRNIDPTLPETWEFSAFSQNGEDGIVDYLVQNLKESNRYFIEIGSSRGVDNNSAWLAIVRKFSGIMVEGSYESHEVARKILSRLNIGVDCINLFVNKENIKELKNASLTTTPDFFSLDIDGNDYYIMTEILDAGFKPKIIAVEYNSAYGPEKSLTIKYDPNFSFDIHGDQYLYYGVSIEGWRRFLCKIGYKYVTVDKNGVNAFFIWPDAFDDSFCRSIKGSAFHENFYQMKKYRTDWEKQFDKISHREFVEI